MLSLQRRPSTLLVFAVVIALSITGSGCTMRPDVVAVQPPPAETPGANLPRSLRQENWLSRGEGSCVHASTISMLNWCSNYQLAQQWRYKYGGGEYESSILAKYDANGLRHQYTRTGSPEFLEWVSSQRRAAIIWYFPNHCVTFAGFGRDSAGGEVAYLLDNNRPNQFLRIPKDKFLQSWLGYGGFAATVLLEPPPPLPFPAYIAR